MKGKIEHVVVLAAILGALITFWVMLHKQEVPDVTLSLQVFETVKHISPLTSVEGVKEELRKQGVSDKDAQRIAPALQGSFRSKINTSFQLQVDMLMCPYTSADDIAKYLIYITERRLQRENQY